MNVRVDTERTEAADHLVGASKTPLLQRRVVSMTQLSLALGGGAAGAFERTRPLRGAG